MAEPKLRFKDEQGREYPEWKRQKLGNIFVQTNNYSTLDDKKELYSLTVENGITPKTERYDRSFLVKKNDKFKIVHKNEFVYNPMNMTIGAVGYNNLRKDIIVSGYYVVMKSNNVSTNEYWYNWLKSPKTIRLFKQKATGSLIEKQRIQFSTFEKIKADIPSLPEQQKIADFLTTVDRQIDIQSQRVEAMKVRKKGLLQKIFSQEIRFRDDEGREFPKWKEKKLGEIALCLDSQRVPVEKNRREEGKIPYYGANGIQGYVKDWLFDGEYVLLAEDGGHYNEYSSKPIAQFIQGKAWVNNHAHIIEADNKNNTKFLFYNLEHKDIRKYINGSTRGKLTQGDMWKILLCIPFLPEQQKIANFLTAVDHQIEVEEKRLETMKTIKKGLLQQMFI